MEPENDFIAECVYTVKCPECGADMGHDQENEVPEFPCEICISKSTGHQANLIRRYYELRDECNRPAPEANQGVLRFRRIIAFDDTYELICIDNTPTIIGRSMYGLVMHFACNRIQCVLFAKSLGLEAEFVEEINTND